MTTPSARSARQGRCRGHPPRPDRRRAVGLGAAGEFRTAPFRHRASSCHCWLVARDEVYWMIFPPSAVLAPETSRALPLRRLTSRNQPLSRETVMSVRCPAASVTLRAWVPRGEEATLADVVTDVMPRR